MSGSGDVLYESMDIFPIILKNILVGHMVDSRQFVLSNSVPRTIYAL